MAAVSAELSSITATVTGLRDRIAGLVVPLATGDEDLAAALYEAERSLLSAARHLERAVRCAR